MALVFARVDRHGVSQINAIGDVPDLKINGLSWLYQPNGSAGDAGRVGELARDSRGFPIGVLENSNPWQIEDFRDASRDINA